LNININIEENFIKLSKENHVAILLEENSFNKRILNLLRKMEIDAFFI
jgi:hypothetical protein